MKKLFILGLDGASFELITLFSEQGIIPNMSKMIKQGYFSCLKSTVPPHTAPGWVSSLCGVNPGQHGIYQFWDTQAKSYEGKFMGSEDVEVPFVWHILNEAGVSTGMVNIPMTHPPKPLNGYILTWPLYNTLKYSYPKELVHDLIKARCHFASDVTTMFQGDMNYIYQAVEIVKKRFETIRYLLDNNRTDFFMSVFTEIDRVSHFYWDYKDKDPMIEDAVKKIYMECDKVVGEILNLIDENTILLIYSDHGFRKCEFDFYIQSYLIQKELMVLKKMEPCHKRQNNWFEGTDKDGNVYQVDWDKTVAYIACPGSYGININMKYRQENGIVEPKDYKKICEMVADTLKDIRHPFKDAPLFQNVYTRDEVYYGKRLAEAPDLILEPEDFAFMVHHKISLDGLYSRQCEQAGIHSMNGILLLYGKPLEEYELHEPESLTDIAPTILYLYGIDKPYYMEGNSILERKKEYKDNGKKNVASGKTEEFFYNEEEQDEMKKRLKNLGYL